MAGLTHDLGVIPVITYAEKFPELYGDPMALQEAIIELRSEVGNTLMEGWNFSQEMVLAAMNADNWDYESPDKGPHLADIVIAAQLHCMMDQGEGDSLPDFADVPAFKKLSEVGFTPERSAEIIKEARDTINEITHLLGS